MKCISILSASIDFDNIDVALIKSRNILLGYTPDISNDAVADIAVGLMIAAGRRFYEGRNKIVNNHWDLGRPPWMLGQDISGSTVGIIGFGGIGQSIVKRLAGFNVGRFLYSEISLISPGMLDILFHENKKPIIICT